MSERLGCGTATVNRFENGSYPIKSDEMVTLLDMYSVGTPGERANLLTLAQEVAQRGWVEMLLSDQIFADFVWAESRAATIQDFQLAVFPGLIQTPEYAEALISRGPASHDDLEVRKLLDVRVARGQIWNRSNPPQAQFLLHEATFYQRIADVSPSVYHDQFKKVLELAEKQNIHIRLLPLQSSQHNILGISSGFTILEMEDSWPTLAHMETPAGAMVAEEPEVNNLVQKFQFLWANGAMDEQRTLEVIDQCMKEVSI